MSAVVQTTEVDLQESRHLDWGDCWNARDLGGLPLEGAGRTAWKKVIRTSSLHVLSDQDWEAVADYGVRTVVDLRSEEERARHPYDPPQSFERRTVPIERGLEEDPEFARWANRGWLSTPLYYKKFLERWPGRVARAMEVIARTDDGGLLVHCSAGRDRTGLIVSLLLSVVGVQPRAIADDHALSRERLETEKARRAGIRNDNETIQKVLDREETSYREALLDFIEPLDVDRRLIEAGVSATDLEELRNLLRVADEH